MNANKLRSRLEQYLAAIADSNSQLRDTIQEAARIEGDSELEQILAGITPSNYLVTIDEDGNISLDESGSFGRVLIKDQDDLENTLAEISGSTTLGLNFIVGENLAITINSDASASYLKGRQTTINEVPGYNFYIRAGDAAMNFGDGIGGDLHLGGGFDAFGSVSGNVIIDSNMVATGGLTVQQNFVLSFGLPLKFLSTDQNKFVALTAPPANNPIADAFQIALPSVPSTASSVLMGDGTVFNQLTWEATGAIAYETSSASFWDTSSPETIKAAVDRLAKAVSLNGAAPIGL